jgi:hypothetical protein
MRDCTEHADIPAGTETSRSRAPWNRPWLVVLRADEARFTDANHAEANVGYS